MKKAKLFSLKYADLIKGFILAVITAIITGLYTSLQSGLLPGMPEIKAMLLTGITAGVGYLLKNLLTNSKDQFMKKENEPV